MGVSTRFCWDRTTESNSIVYFFLPFSIFFYSISMSEFNQSIQFKIYFQNIKSMNKHLSKIFFDHYRKPHLYYRQNSNLNSKIEFRIHYFISIPSAFIFFSILIYGQPIIFFVWDIRIPQIFTSRIYIYNIYYCQECIFFLLILQSIQKS